MNETMQFRDYIFRHNPQSVTVSHSGGIASHFCPGRGELTQDTGQRAASIRCRGSFFGKTPEDAVGQLREFREKTTQSRRGTLFLPGLPPYLVLLREISFEAQGNGRIIPYSLEFVETGVEGG